METLKDIRERNYCGNSCRGCEFLSYCDDCEKKICSAYDKDYRNIDETTETLCGECYQLGKIWNKAGQTTQALAKSSGN